MPGSSLWLLPPTSSPIYPILTQLISQSSDRFSSPHTFLPHITLTSEIDPSVYGSDPQAWLDTLSFLSGEGVAINFERVKSEDVFFRKLYIAVEKSDGLKTVAETARRTVSGYEGGRKAQVWVEENYGPHISLLYHDIPQISQDEIDKVEHMVKEAGISLKGEGEHGGWQGGRVILVPTDNPIKDWKPIAEREL